MNIPEILTPIPEDDHDGFTHAEYFKKYGGHVHCLYCGKVLSGAEWVKFRTMCQACAPESEPLAAPHQCHDDSGHSDCGCRRVPNFLNGGYAADCDVLGEHPAHW